MSSIRPMLPLDLLNFAPVNLDPLTETYDIGFYLEYMAKWPHMCHVIVSKDDEIEGYILGKVEASSGYQQPTALPYSPDTNKNMNYLPWHAHITALTVAPKCRRLGHARKLTELFENQSDEQNCWFVDLFVRSDNGNAIALYKSMGYSIFRRVLEYYQDGTDAFDMRKPLKRDVSRKHVRENGMDFEVDPSDVWVLLYLNEILKRHELSKENASNAAGGDAEDKPPPYEETEGAVTDLSSLLANNTLGSPECPPYSSETSDTTSDDTVQPTLEQPLSLGDIFRLAHGIDGYVPNPTSPDDLFEFPVMDNDRGYYGKDPETFHQWAQLWKRYR